MSGELTVAMTVYRRPHYLKIILAYLAKCVGIEQCQIVIHIEPGCNETINVCKDAGKLITSMVLNNNVCGLRQNFLNAMDDAFSHSNYVIWLTDDIVPASDFLEYHEWCRKTFVDDKEVMAVSCYNWYDVFPSSKLFAVKKYYEFKNMAIGLWKDRWNVLSQEIRKHDYDNGKGWDYVGAKLVGLKIPIQALDDIKQQYKVCIHPYISRIKYLPHNDLLSTHSMTISDWIEKFYFKCWSDHFMPQQQVKNWRQE